MNSNDIKVISWSSEYEEQALDLLNKYKETSMFLLGNLNNYGFVKGSHYFSGNYKCLIKNNKVIAVFVLAQSGIVLIQTDRKDNYSNIILDDCLSEGINIKHRSSH